jgi:hypothetical protein
MEPAQILNQVVPLSPPFNGQREKRDEKSHDRRARVRRGASGTSGQRTRSGRARWRRASRHVSSRDLQQLRPAMPERWSELRDPRTADRASLGLRARDRATCLRLRARLQLRRQWLWSFKAVDGYDWDVEMAKRRAAPRRSRRTCGGAMDSSDCSGRSGEGPLGRTGISNVLRERHLVGVRVAVWAPNGAPN